MGHMSIKYKDESTLVLLREPAISSIATYAAILVGVCAIVLFGSDSACCVLLKLFVTTLVLGLGSFGLDKYEVCEFDKANSEVRTASLHSFQYWFGKVLGLTLQPNVVAKLDEVKDLKVKLQDESGPVKQFQVVLVMESGEMLSITETFSSQDTLSHGKIEEDFQRFLDGGDDEAEKSDNEDDSTEDDFEQISQSELESLKVQAPIEGGDAPEDREKEQPEAEGGKVKDEEPAEEKDKGQGHCPKEASS